MRRIALATDCINTVLGFITAPNVPGYDSVSNIIEMQIKDQQSASNTTNAIIGACVMLVIKVAGNLLGKWIDREFELKAKKHKEDE